MLNNWQVYQLNNDGQKVVIKKNLTYESAVKLSQKLNEEIIRGERGQGSSFQKEYMKY